MRWATCAIHHRDLEVTKASMRAIHSSRKPVRDVNVIRCEFCWTISKFLDAIHVPYEMIEFDLLKYAERSRREIPP